MRRPTSVKTCDFFLRDFNRATIPTTHLPILVSCFIYFLFPLLSSFTHFYHVFPTHSGCLTTTLLHQTHSATQSCSPAFYLHLFFFRGQSAVNKAELISAIASQTALSILGLTETWIRPEDSATPAALSNFKF